MGRAVKDARLDKRDTRLRLAVRKEPHWRLISEGAHLGYYRGARVSKWVARYRRPGAAGGYLKKTLGEADDMLDADGAAILNFRQADDEAREWFKNLAREREAEASGPVLTVCSAVESYIAVRDARESERQGRKLNSSAAHKLKLHVLADAKLADTELSRLDASALKAWRKGLPGSATSRQRVTNDFKAALNRTARSAAIGLAASVRLAAKEGLSALHDEQPDAAKDGAPNVGSKILTDQEIRCFLEAVREAGNEDLYRMCLVLASTGARFAQARRLKLLDLDVSGERILMPASHKGRSRGPEKTPTWVPVGRDVIDALLPAIRGRASDEPLLERWRHVQIGPAKWRRDSRGAWQSASEMAPAIRAAVKAAELPAGTSSYSFRHSSIVRLLRDGLPAQLVARLHDTSLAMLESNYTRFIAHALEDMARKVIVPLVNQDRAITL